MTSIPPRQARLAAKALRDWLDRWPEQRLHASEENDVPEIEEVITRLDTIGNVQTDNVVDELVIYSNETDRLIVSLSLTPAERDALRPYTGEQNDPKTVGCYSLAATCEAFVEAFAADRQPTMNHWRPAAQCGNSNDCQHPYCQCPRLEDQPDPQSS